MPAQPAALGYQRNARVLIDLRVTNYDLVLQVSNTYFHKHAFVHIFTSSDPV